MKRFIVALLFLGACAAPQTAVRSTTAPYATPTPGAVAVPEPSYPAPGYPAPARRQTPKPTPSGLQCAHC